MGSLVYYLAPLGGLVGFTWEMGNVSRKIYGTSYFVHLSSYPGKKQSTSCLYHYPK